MNAPLELSSPNNPRIQQVRQLREAKWRRRSGLFLIDGVDEIRQAAESGFEIQSLFFHAHNHLEIDCSQYQLPETLMAKIGYAHRSDQPVAVAKTPDLALGNLDRLKCERLLVLDRAEKPGNVGACLRTAAACKIDALILCDPICEVFNPNAIRASRGAAFRVPVAVATQAELMHWLPAEMQILTARIDGSTELWDCDFRGSHCLVFGNEAEGLGENWDIDRTTAFRIPMDAVTDSLNLSNSCAVTLYEARRQRDHL